MVYAAFLRLFPLLPLFILIQGCSPEHNWRELSLPELRVLLPGKPATMSRDVNLEGLAVKLTMQGARAANSSYTVAYGDLPLGANPDAALASMRKAMLRNIGATDGKASTVQIPVFDSAGNERGRAEGTALEASGQVSMDGKQRAVRMRARFVSYQGRIVQAVAMGERLDDEQSSTFLDSLRLLGK